jgi:acylphosphatase
MDADVEVVRIVLAGRGLDEDFVDFVLDRAHRFSLGGSVALEDGEIRILAEGPSALIDMMEVACMLGPVQCLVDDVRREPWTGPVPAGRFART